MCAVCEQKNHLSGLKRKLLKVSFYNVQHLMDVRREVAPIIAANSKRSTMADAVAALQAGHACKDGGRPKVTGLWHMLAAAVVHCCSPPSKTGPCQSMQSKLWRCLRLADPVSCCAARVAADSPQDVLECLLGMREYDVPYHVRFAIDTGESAATGSTALMYVHCSGRCTLAAQTAGAVLLRTACTQLPACL